MDAVVKVGGSLSKHPLELKSLCAKLSILAKRYKVAIVPGGDGFADAVRKLDLTYGFPAGVSHKMAILAMDQYGLMLSALIPGSSLHNSLAKVRNLTRKGRVAIILPSKPLLMEDPFEPSWDVTSDSITAYIAAELHAAKAIFVTDVDGIYSVDPKKKVGARLFTTAQPDDLLKLKVRTSVDRFLPRFLTRNRIDCYVVNGFYPERVEALLVGRETVCTRILTCL